MNRRPIFFLLAPLFFVQACAQTKNAWVKANGFYFVRIPGTLPVDEEGRALELKRDTVFSVYAETQGTVVNWEKAWRNGRSFSLLATPMGKEKVTVGEAPTGNRKIELTPAKGAAFYKLELTGEGQTEKPPKAIKRNGFLLKGTVKGKPVYVAVNSFTETASPLYH